jgi:NAD(P)-dependent dehydrogenase (short-subunit alcohol dehydrogenase family)
MALPGGLCGCRYGENVTSQWTTQDISNLAEKIAVVTGANSGIGYEMVRALIRKRAMVILACRNKDKGEAAVQRIAQEYPGAKAELGLLDLSSLALVRRFAGEFTHRYDRLDILINNAGIMRTPFGKTADGFSFPTHWCQHVLRCGPERNHPLWWTSGY